MNGSDLYTFEPRKVKNMCFLGLHFVNIFYEMQPNLTPQLI